MQEPRTALTLTGWVRFRHALLAPAERHGTMLLVHPGDRTYRNQIVRITDLTVTEDVIHGAIFENCTIVGPAVVILLGDTNMTGCTFEGEADAFLWPLGSRHLVIGAIGLSGCTLRSCRLQRIGLAYTADQAHHIENGFSPSES